MRVLTDRDFLSGLVLLAVGAVSLAEAGSDVRNWIFPLLATYLMMVIGAVLILKVVVGAAFNRAADAITMEPQDMIVVFDVVVFCVIVLGYILLMHGLGFWLASFIMLLLSSLYLTLEKTRRNLMMAIVVPLATCVIAYVVFLHVFYVPVPEARWWAGFR